MKPIQEKFTNQEHNRTMIHKLNEQNVELKKRLSELSNQLSEGRHYLMGVEPSELSVEDALEAFGFGRNGLG